MILSQPSTVSQPNFTIFSCLGASGQLEPRRCSPASLGCALEGSRPRIPEGSRASPRILLAGPASQWAQQLRLSTALWEAHLRAEVASSSSLFSQLQGLTWSQGIRLPGLNTAASVSLHRTGLGSEFRSRLRLQLPRLGRRSLHLP